MRRWRGVVWGAVALMAVVGADAATREETMQLTSAVFKHGEAIPALYTCEGQDISPPMAWTEPPPGTASFALISDDPDAPMGTWVHWVLYNVPSSRRQLPESFPTDTQLADGTRQGVTDFKRPGYGGPCPPSGTHRYFFKLYALDAILSLKPGATAAQLEQAMQGRILAQAELMGTYRRRGR